jgi:hypothetical protein
MNNPSALIKLALVTVRSRDKKTDANSRIVPYKPDEAKTKLLGAKINDEVATIILSLEPKRPLVMSALVDMMCSDHTAKAIANRYSLKSSAFQYWARRIGLPMRQRGRRARPRPTAQHARILDLVREHGIAGTARQVGVSRQRVHQIVCRWEPGLRRRAAEPKLKVLRPPKRRAPRNIVVSFRISTDEWERLLETRSYGGKSQMSGFAKARAIVLSHISAPDGGGNESTRIPGCGAGDEKEFVDIHRQNAA